TRIGGQQNSVVLQKLKPDTPYTITLSSLYPDVEGAWMTGRGETMVRRLARDVQVYSPTPNSWDDLDPAPGRCRSTVWCALPWLARGPRNLTMQQTEESESLERQPSACPRTGITLMGQLSSKGSFFVPPLVTQLMNM
ncbi:Collagen alpha-1, partial [Camelus dromedarius]